MPAKHVDVLIMGAGISGVGAACHLTRDFPERSYHILERRQAIGGTWDLFRYPGIRSDSDMYTFGFNFRPWRGDEGARRRHVHPRVRQCHRRRVRRARTHHASDARSWRADWSSATGQWTVEALDEASGTSRDVDVQVPHRRHRLLQLRQRVPAATSRASRTSKARIVHPQHWPADLDYAGKRVLVIGSGATAVTLVPAMAETAAHVTMLQRSPSYILSLPAVDKIVAGMQKVLPDQLVYRLVRGRNIAIQRALYGAGAAPSRARPQDRHGCCAQATRSGRGHDALQPQVRPVGPAAVHHPRRRSVRIDPRGPGRRRHRHDRDVHQDRRAHLVRARAGRRRDRDRDRPAGAAARRRARERRSANPCG